MTGGNGGIGLGMAKALAQSGADICIWGQNEEKNKTAVEKLRPYGRKVAFFKCNVSDENQVEEILPGWIETDMTSPLFNLEKFEKNVIPRIPQRRWGIPADFGPIAVYFASDASAYHSGDAVTIDGGYSCF